MPKSLSAEAILFAVNSALRLSPNIRRAYVNSLKSTSVLLPLPPFDNKPDPYTVNRFFELEGAGFLEEIEALKYLHRKSQIEVLSQEEFAEYQEYYRSLFFMLSAGDTHQQIKEAGLQTDDLLSLLKIRQWETDSKFASTSLQLVAGTIVEISIDYFNLFPVSIQPDTVMGQALSGLLNALDTIPFSQEEDFKKSISHKIIPRLFITAVGTICELPEKWVRDEKTRQFIEAAAKGINEDLYERIGPDLSTDEMEEVIHWGQLLLSSLIRNADHYVFYAPNRFGGLNNGARQLIRHTGLVIMELLYAEEELQLDLKKTLTSHTLDVLIKPAFVIFSDYPDLLTKEPPFRLIIKEVSLAVARSPVPISSLLPEVLRLILERTADHLPVVWDHEKASSKHLLVITLQLFLKALEPSLKKDSIRISSRQILELLKLLMDEVVSRPAWITAKTGKDRPISLLIDLSLKALQKITAAERTSTVTISRLLNINMRAIAFDTRVLDKVLWPGDKAEKRILEKLIELVFDFTFHKTASGSLHKTETALDLLDLMVRRVLRLHPNHLGLRIAGFLLEEDVRLQLSKGINEKMVDAYMETLLDITTAHPDIMAPNPNLRQIITGVAQSLQESGLDRPGLLPRVLQLVFIQKADTIEFHVEDKNIKESLLEALRQILEALSFEPEKGQWKPIFTGDHILEIVLYLLEEISENLDWVDGDQKVYKTLHVILESLELIPRHRRPSFSLIKLMIIKLFEVVHNHPGYLNGVSTSDETDKIVLQVTLEQLFKAIYEQETIKATLDIIHQPSVMDALLDYYLYRTSFLPIEEATILEAAGQVGISVKKLEEGHLNSGQEFLDELRDRLA